MSNEKSKRKKTMEDNLKIIEKVESGVVDVTGNVGKILMDRIKSRETKKQISFIYFVYLKSKEGINIFKANDFSFGLYGLSRQTVYNYCNYLDGLKLLLNRGSYLMFITDEMKKFFEENGKELDEIFNAHWGVK